MADKISWFGGAISSLVDKGLDKFALPAPDRDKAGKEFFRDCCGVGGVMKDGEAIYW